MARFQKLFIEVKRRLQRYDSSAIFLSLFKEHFRQYKQLTTFLFLPGAKVFREIYFLHTTMCLLYRTGCGEKQLESIDLNTMRI